MASNLSTIGFPVASQHAYVDLTMRVAREGGSVPFPGGRYILWSPGGGAELWVRVAAGGPIEGGAVPHFAGPGRVKVSVIGVERHREHPTDGMIRAWADPEGPDPESGAYPFLVDVPDFERVAGALPELPAAAVLQVAAFARQLDCWADEDAYHEAEREKWGGRPGFASESFIPSGTFVPGGGDREVAEAIFTGEVEEAERVTNPATGASFHRLLVKTLGGRYDVVADPTVPNGEPAAGGVVQGTFWLTGRVVEA